MKKLLTSLVLITFIGIGCTSSQVTEATLRATQNNTKSLQLIKAELVPLAQLFRATLAQVAERDGIEVTLEDGTIVVAYWIDKDLVDNLLILLTKQYVGMAEYPTIEAMWDSRLEAYILRSRAIEAGVKVDKKFSVRDLWNLGD